MKTIQVPDDITHVSFFKLSKSELKVLIEQAGSIPVEKLQCGVMEKIDKELERAKKLHPGFPCDIVYQSAILAEEAGECVRAALNVIHEGGDIEEFYTEAIHTAAVAIRILENRGK